MSSAPSRLVLGPRVYDGASPPFHLSGSSPCPRQPPRVQWTGRRVGTMDDVRGTKEGESFVSRSCQREPADTRLSLWVLVAVGLNTSSSDGFAQGPEVGRAPKSRKVCGRLDGPWPAARSITEGPAGWLAGKLTGSIVEVCGRRPRPGLYCTDIETSRSQIRQRVREEGGLRQ